jgi:hypothetical protein
MLRFPTCSLLMLRDTCEHATVQSCCRQQAYTGPRELQPGQELHPSKQERCCICPRRSVSPIHHWIKHRCYLCLHSDGVTRPLGQRKSFHATVHWRAQYPIWVRILNVASIVTPGLQCCLWCGCTVPSRPRQTHLHNDESAVVSSSLVRWQWHVSLADFDCKQPSADQQVV